MPFDTIDTRIAAAGVVTIRKLAGKNIEISDITVSADAQSTLTITDSVKSYVLDVKAGDGHRCPGYIFNGENNVTITGAGGNVSLYCHVWKK